MTFLKVTHYSHANDFFDRLLDEWTVQRHGLYRGEADANWELRPSAWRSPRLTEFADFLRQSDGHEKWLGLLPSDEHGFGDPAKYLRMPNATRENLQALVYHLRPEATLIDAFCDHCDSVALRVPGIATARARVLLTDLLCNVPHGNRPQHT